MSVFPISRGLVETSLFAYTSFHVSDDSLTSAVVNAQVVRALSTSLILLAGVSFLGFFFTSY